MVEHRLIERMVELMKAEAGRVDSDRELHVDFIDRAVDFIRVYADRTHHGKEEEILFRDLADKDLAPDHDAAMQELIAEHRYARDMTGQLVEAKQAYQDGERQALERAGTLLNRITEFYPSHIAKEDDHFFPAAMDYLGDEEQQQMLQRFREFDRSMIHEKYQSVVKSMETGSKDPSK